MSLFPDNYVSDIEFQPKEIIKRFQEEKLHEHLVYLKAKSPFYQKMSHTKRYATP